MCYHHGSPVDPEERDRVPPDAPRPYVGLLSSFISRYLPGLEPQPAVVETCLYTVRTPQEWDPGVRGPKRFPTPRWTLPSRSPTTLSPGEHPWPHTLTLWLPQNTPDEDFILDRHPKFSNIIIGAGFSGRRGHPPCSPELVRTVGVPLSPYPRPSAGHGFKLAPVVGELLCELSLGEEPSHSTAAFTITRFPSVLQPKM